MYDFEEIFKKDKKILKSGMIYNDLDSKMARRYTVFAAILKKNGVCDTKVSFKDSIKNQLRKSFWSSLSFII